MTSINEQVREATLAAFDTGPTGITGFNISVEETSDGTLTGRITKTSDFDNQGTPPGDPLPFEATFDPSQFEDVPTRQIGEDEDVTLREYSELDPVASDATSRLANLENVAIAAGGPTAATNQTAKDVVSKLAAVDLSSDRLFVTNAPGNAAAGRSLSLYPTEQRDSSPLGSLLFEDRGGLSTVLSTLSDVSSEDVQRLDNSEIISGPSGSAFSDDVSSAAETAETRRQLRDRLDQTLEAEGYEPDRWNTDARADGTLILQDPETNQTRTIDPDDDLGSAISEQTADGSFETTSSSSSTSASRSSSSMPSVDDLGGSRVAAAVALGAAILFGMTQS